MLAKNVGEVVAEVKLLRAQNTRQCILVVEGLDDLRFWQARVHTQCDVVYATCKTIGKAAINRLNASAFVGHLGIFDCDYDDFLVLSDLARNMVFWPGHSLEVTLVLSDAYSRVLAEKLGAVRLPLACGGAAGLRAQILDVGEVIGRCRALRQFSGNQGDAGALSVGNFVSFKDGVKLDRAGLGAALAAMRVIPSAVQLDSQLKALPVAAMEHYTRGHDLTAILAICVAALTNKSCGGAEIERGLRLAFHTSDLVQSQTFAEIRAWESLRRPFRVLH